MDNTQVIDIQDSIPEDIAIKIASSLQVLDVCSLGSCSKFWRGLCGSDSVWEVIYKDRWPEFSVGEASLASQSQSEGDDKEMETSSKGWRGLYMSKHYEMVGKADLVKQFVERALAFDSLEVGNYLKAIDLLRSLCFGFKDVRMFLLQPELSVLINLIGLHYCIIWLNIPFALQLLSIAFPKAHPEHMQAGNLIEALNSCNISERQVCVQWWKLGRWFYGFRLRDELHSRNVSLDDLAASNEEVLGVLHRGAIHEVIRVQILPAKQSLPSWSYLVDRI